MPMSKKTSTSTMRVVTSFLFSITVLPTRTKLSLPPGSAEMNFFVVSSSWLSCKEEKAVTFKRRSPLGVGRDAIPLTTPQKSLQILWRRKYAETKPTLIGSFCRFFSSSLLADLFSLFCPPSWHQSFPSLSNSRTSCASKPLGSFIESVSSSSPPFSSSSSCFSLCLAFFFLVVAM